MLLFLGSGCQPAAKPEATTTETTAASGEKTPEAEAEAEKESPWVGRWMLVITEQSVDFHPLLMQIMEQSGQRGISQMDTANVEEFKSWKLAGAAFQPDRVLLGIDTGEVVLHFVGTIHDDVVLGAIFPEGKPLPTPARLVKTAETSLRKQETPLAIPGSEVLSKAMQSNNAEEIRGFIAAYQNNPLVFNAYEALLSNAVQAQLPLDQVTEIASQMLESARRWGPELAANTSLQIVAQLDFVPEYRSLTEKYLQETRTLLGEEIPEEIASRLAIFDAQFLLTSAAEEEQKKGVEQLLEILKESPFELGVLLSLGRHYEQTAQAAEALQLYTKLAVLPGLSRMIGKIKDPASAQEVTLQEKSRSLFQGDDAAYEKYLGEVYDKEAYFFVKERDNTPVLAENRRVPLLELFTGAMCPPCVAGDLAVGGLEKYFPVPEIVVVRYHQHIPGPDPLTNAASEARFGFYGGGGTPSLFINGRPWESVGGYVMHADSHYQQLLTYVSNQLGRTSTISIDLKAEVNNGELEINAKAAPISKDRPHLKLRLLLVENVIPYVAPNGIRTHEMVVRAMPGGTNGIGATEGTAQIQTQVSLEELKNQLKTEVSTFETNRNYKFDEVPLELNQFRVVAFVQDEETKDILQTAITPLLSLTGNTEAEKKVEPENKPAGETAKEETAKPAEPAEAKPESTGVELTPVESTPVESPATGANPAGSTPVESTPVESTPVESAPAENAPTN